MAFIAVFLVFVAFNYLKIDLDLKPSQQKSDISFALDDDWDNDGLTNRKESFWGTDPNNSDTDGDGYLDGEEIASGHDPLIPSPDDLLSAKINLTEKMSSLALSGLYEGSLKPGNPEYNNSVDQLVSAIISDAIKSSPVDTSDINLTITDSGRSSQEDYIRNVSKIIENIVKTFASQMKNFENTLNTIGNYGFNDSGLIKDSENASSQYNSTFKELHRILVPNNWEHSHLDLMKFTRSLSETSQIIAQGKDDPIKAVAALNQLFSLWTDLPGLMEVFTNKISNENLDVRNTIFAK